MAMVAPGFFARMDANERYYELHDAAAGSDAPVRDYSRAYERFEAGLDRDGAVLGVGSGDGRYLRHFKDRGWPVLGVEPCAARRQRAQAGGIPSIAGAFENLTSLALPHVVGVWCGAALRRVPEDRLVRALRNVAAVLSSRGRVFIQVELGEGAEWIAADADHPDAEILVQRIPESALADALASQGLRVEAQWTDVDAPGRPGRWLSVVAVKP